MNIDELYNAGAEMVRIIQQIDREVAAAEVLVMDLRQKLHMAERSVDLLEATTLQAVEGETRDGKKVFSNDGARKAEVALRLGDAVEVKAAQSLREQIAHAEMDLSLKDRDLKRIYRGVDLVIARLQARG